MAWTERDLRTGEQMEVTAEKAVKLNAGKEADLPKIQKEEMKAFDPVKYQPVRSPGNYDAEFGVKGKDLIFHFWPYNYHEAERRNVAPPRFVGDFVEKVTAIWGRHFGEHRIEVKKDDDMGAIFVKAHGWGENQFAFDLAVKACKNLHLALGGSEA